MVGLPDLEETMQQLEAAAKAEQPAPSLLHTLLEQIENALPEAISAVQSDLEKISALTT